MGVLWLKVILTAFALHLTLPVYCQFKFGDLVAFNRTSKLRPDVTIYMHWAVYVGKGTVRGLENIKNDDEDIFHITGYVFPKASDCLFGNMDEVSGKPWKFNYLDGKVKIGAKAAALCKVKFPTIPYEGEDEL
ncbi:HRAS-like suppressor 2 [Labeo rohita]|uniref:HRAS-like suppressor 2 n=1 Tax=Labeo rohita TaxID=84645 RepID=A0A498MWL1_LABRO|nr:HRAS-like suppressor 2 [Labeo rohita]